jgi:plasmid stability protein
VATLTVKNGPESLVGRLKHQAALHRRSLNHEVIAGLEAVTFPTRLDHESLLARGRAVRRRPSRIRLTDRSLTRLKTAERL